MNLAYVRGFPTVSVKLVRHISAIVSGTVAQNFPATGVGVIESFLEMLPHPLQQPFFESYRVGKVHFLRNQISQPLCMKPEIFFRKQIFAGRVHSNKRDLVLARSFFGGKRSEKLKS